MTGYIRLDVTNAIANGEIIDADVFDLEFDGVVAAFNATTGHAHGGAVGEGAPITVVGPAQDLIVGITNSRPKVTNTMDLGTTSLRFKDIYLSGSVKYSTPATARTDLGLGTAALVNTGTGASDVPTTAQADVRYVNVGGDTMTGGLTTPSCLLSVGNAGIRWDGASVLYELDASDYLFWNRAINTGGFQLGSVFYQLDDSNTLGSPDSVVRRGLGDLRYATLSGATFTGQVNTPILGIDSTCVITVSSGDVLFNLDSSDFLTFDRDTSELSLVVGGVTAARFDSAGGSAPNGQTVITREKGDVRYAALSGASFTGTVSAPAFAVDAQSFWNITSGDVLFVFDSNDYLEFDRPTNALRLLLGGVEAVRFEAAGTTLPTATSIVTREKGDARYAPLSGGNASTLLGATSAEAATGSTVALRNSGGDLSSRYALTEFVNMSHSVVQANSDTIFYSSTDAFIRKNNAAGMRASLGLGTAALLNAGGGAGDLVTVSQGNSSYAAIANAWPGQYTGTDANNLTFPVGTILVVIGGSGVNRVGTASIYLGTDARQYQFAVNGTALTGTWRSRGVIPDDVGGNWSALMQRVS